jgi:hypothetical protein
MYLQLKRDPDRGFSARITLEPEPPAEPVAVMGFGWSSLTHAVKSAVHHALGVLNNPLVQMALPPGAAPALTIVHRLADMAHAGHLNKIVKGKAVWEHFHDPTLRHLAKQFAEAAAKGKDAHVSGKPVCLLDCEQARSMGWRGGRPSWGAHRPHSFAQRVAPGAWLYHHHHPHHPAPPPPPVYALPPAPPPPVIDAPPPPPPPAIDPAAPPPDAAPSSPPDAAAAAPASTSGWSYGTRPPARDFRAAYRRIYGPQSGRVRMSRYPVR